ncbi:MAG: cupredoxin domain-containing protein [Myxococcales bacterium]|nr:cupredoxin domain-containing protein [Myxococcales bacterium]
MRASTTTLARSRIQVLALGFGVVLGLGLGGCSKKDSDQAAKPAPAPTTVSADGVRTVPIEAGKDGYVPDKIPGKPGEKLKLVFTRTVDADCLAQVKVAGGQPVDLPKGKPIEISITVPATGQLTFACGMDMYTGVIVADKS